jgi:hypothetical protein
LVIWCGALRVTWVSGASLEASLFSAQWLAWLCTFAMFAIINVLLGGVTVAVLFVVHTLEVFKFTVVSFYLSWPLTWRPSLV